MANLDKIKALGNKARMIAYAITAAVFVFCANAHAAITHDPSLSWKVLHSLNFNVHYHDGEEALARETIAIAEKVHGYLSPWFKWTPAEPVDIVLTDQTDFSNGSATPIPGNHMTIYVAAPDDPPLEDHAGWLETVITHEYTHILHLDKAKGGPAVMRKIFGRVPTFIPNFFPNLAQPLWLIEGLATYVETDPARGIGRGQSSFTDMIMRMEVQNGIKPIQQVNLPITTWPGGGARYYYGVHFYRFIEERYGQDKVKRFVDEYSDDLLPFFVNRNSKKVFRKNLNRMWGEFERYLNDKYKPQLAAIEQQGTRTGEQLTHDGYFGGGVRALPDGTVFYIRNDGRSDPYLMKRRPGAAEPESLCKLQHGARLDAHPAAGVLVTQIEIQRNTNYYSDLYRVNPKNGSIKRLTHGARYRFAVWSPDGERIIAVYNMRGVNSLQLLDARGKLIETLWTGAPGEVIADLSWSPDGAALVASVWRQAQGWNLERFTLGDRRWQALTQDAAIEMHPQFAPEGQAVLFTSDHGGIYNLRRLDLASGRVATLTNVPGGAFYPTMTADGTLYYSGYGAQGFDLYRLAAAEPLPTPSAPQGPSAVAAAPAPEPPSLTISEYTPWNTLRPRWWLPHIVYDSERRAEFGFLTAGSDVLQRHLYGLDVAYDGKNDEFVGSLDYFYDRWYPLFKLHASRQNYFFYQDTGTASASNLELQRKRHVDKYQAEMVLPFLSVDSDIGVHFAALQNREEDEDVAQGVRPVPPMKDNLLGLGIVYDSAKSHPLSISRSDGRYIALIGEDSDTLGGDFTGNVYTLDWREFLSLGGEHVLAARIVGGRGTDMPRPFRLGGYDSSGQISAIQAIVESPALGTIFDQRDYALRGYRTGLPQLSGRRMQIGSLEWRFPLARIERGAMVPFPIGVHQVWGSVFVDSGAAWDDGHRPADYFTGVGVEAQARVVLFYWLPLDVRLGYAHGRDEIGEHQVYLRVGTSF